MGGIAGTTNPCRLVSAAGSKGQQNVCLKSVLYKKTKTPRVMFQTEQILVCSPHTAQEDVMLCKKGKKIDFKEIQVEVDV